MRRSDPRRVADYLDHIREAIERIERYVSDLDETAFLRNEMVQDAVIRNFEIIGEASHNIERMDSSFFKAHPDLPLGVAYRMRNALAHGYSKVQLDIVWKTIEDDLPELYEKATALFRELENES